jgi:hypothetical protein
VGDVDAKYRSLVPRSGRVTSRVDSNLDLIHALDRRSSVSDLTSLIAAV